MDQDGYIILKNVLIREDIQFGISSIQSDQKVDYTIMKNS